MKEYVLTKRLTTVSSFVDDIEAGAGKLNTFAQRSKQEVLVGFELTTIRKGGRCPTTGPSGFIITNIDM